MNQRFEITEKTVCYVAFFGVLATILIISIFYLVKKPIPPETELKTGIQSDKKEIQETSKQIDSVLTEISTAAHKTAEYSSKLNDKITHEKPIIHDASYDSMCKYITDYRAE